MNVQPRLFSLAVLTLTCSLGINGCDKPPATPVATQSPAPAAPTPVLDSLRQVWVECGKAAPNEVAYVYPTRANIEFDKAAPANAAETLTKWLEAHQTQMAELEAISRKRLEPFPEVDLSTPESMEANPTRWLAGLKLCALADASRLYQNRDFSGAASRIATLVRFSSQFVSQENGAFAYAGAGMLSQACGKLDAMVTAGGMNTVSGAEIREALARFDPADPTGKIKSWPDDARRQLAAYRTELSGSDAGKKLAKQLEDFGVTTPEVASVPQDGLERTFAMIPRKAGADRVKKMSAKKIAKILDQAEAMIEPISKALASRDDATLISLGNQILADDTQVIRLAVGDGISLLELNKVFADSVSKAIAAAAKMGP